jgi:hypothetical protein
VTGRYIGAPWRSRFLRAPKYALILFKDSRFVPLGSLADVRLGIKSGNDGFFFVAPTGQLTERTLTSGRSVRINVIGLKGWRGDIQAKDLSSAVLNPHRLFRGEDDRRFVIPKVTGSLYLKARDQAPSADLAEYVRFAEAQGVHETPLVRQNGIEPRWWVQARTVIAPRWVLPYNSLYDYGAWDNEHRAVINGRFVGVQPLDDVDADLLGAALNTTLVVMSRLLEGVTTGVEGAFDVGPPAARRMVVPDPRQFQDRHHARVREILDEVRRGDRMPPAPNEHAEVEGPRRRLDEAVLIALGYTRGDASVVLGRCYEAYGRWRAMIRQMQVQMERNRTAMNRAGVGRTGDLSKRVADQIWDELAPSARLFPSGALSASEPMTEVSPDHRWRPGRDRPMFGEGHVRSATGRDLDVGSWEQAQYVGLLLDLGFRAPLLVPTNSRRAAEVVRQFAIARDIFIQSASERARLYVGDRSDAITDLVLRRWYAECRRSGMSD